MTENEARKTLEIFDRERKEYMESMPSNPYFDRVKADNFTQALNISIESLEEIQQYQAIGTVEECREARERQRGKKPVKDEYNHDCCPNCGWAVYQEEWGGRYLPHCENCGQAIDWSDTP